ncbi:MAG: hypothetical protein IJP11_04470, partial [Oscillospiraceae bacterium]|nr:hypothetical protein [Oscillospiraceae bacterium]
IGMSQMGAKNMAKEHGMVHSEILEFYYPGTTLTTIATGNWGADSSVTIGASFVTGITPGTDASVLLKALGGGYSLCSSDGSSKTSGKLLTGDIVKDAAGKTYPVVIYGDLNSDGEIALTDLLRQQKHLLGMITLEGACLEAADVTKDGKVDIADLLRIQKHLLGAATIGQ